MRIRLASLLLTGLLLAVLIPASAQAAPPAATTPKPNWLPADKQGFGTSRTLASKVWFTLEGGELSEVYYPTLDTPSFRDLQFSVDGVAERDGALHRAVLLDPGSLTYRQINTDKRGRWRLIKSYVTDPSRAVVLVDVEFQSLDGRRHRVSMLADAAPSNETDSSPGTCSPSGVLASDAQMAIAVAARPALKHLVCTGGSDGIVASTAATGLTGKPRHQRLTLALAFATTRGGALSAAHASLRVGWFAVARRYGAGWLAYLTGLRHPPRSLTSARERAEYAVSEMVLAASEDKTYRGAFVASPTMPWAWGTGLQTPSGPYHLVWSRDLYEIATALIADGDVAGARRALNFLFFRQQQPDGSFPQNSDVTGKPALTNLQLDEVSDPIILAWQLGVHDPTTWSHVKLAADFIVGWHDDQGHTAPYTPQERWENQAGYSPATIAAEIAGLVCAASIAQRSGDAASAAKYLQTADAWHAQLNAWTFTTTGPYGSGSYYLRLTKDGNPNSPTTYSVGDSGPTLDQRAVVDPSFLELVRLGVVAPDDPHILSTLPVVDTQLSVDTPNGRFWHRYNGDGYGEQRDGAPWDVGFPPGSQTTIGRAWPIFAGERGEYELAAGHGAAAQLHAMAAAANAVGFIPEQVWDQNPPSGQPGFAPGTPTFSATPLAWSHAQFIRLAWSIAAGHPVEQPTIVACRYVRSCG
ncbi:MAG: hypothetical protein JO046_13040 [Solirubrobacterales bacterium]|nr:hypothetical protein [Solirubrobacterales bacterium]MBV9682715.1 hypothetical protein [Solirubrobacterales bacterium]